MLNQSINLYDCVQVCTSSLALISRRDDEVSRRRDVDVKLQTLLRHSREMVLFFKKMSVISDSSGSDSLALVPSTLMQFMTLERSVCLASLSPSIQIES